MKQRGAAPAIVAAIVVAALSALCADGARPGSFAEFGDLRGVSRAKTWKTLQASGYDRGDGFIDSGNFLRTEPGPRYVLMETTGPGCIDRMWFTRKSAREPYELCIYLDSAADPVIRIDLETLRSGAQPPFEPPFAGAVDLARYSYVPIGFRTSARVVLVPTAASESYQWRTNSAGERIPHIYYQITYRRLAEDAEVHPFQRELAAEERCARDAVRTIWNHAGASPWAVFADLTVKEARVVLSPAAPVAPIELAGPAVIHAIEIRVPKGSAARLSIAWDGETASSVDAPLGVLCAAPAQAEARGLWTGFADGRYYLFFPMPFKASARVVLRDAHDGGALSAHVRIAYRARMPYADDLRFHASAYDYSSPAIGEDYVVLATKGRGHLVAIAMDNPGNMEGDDRFFVDNEATPSIHGTGTEDFFNFAWGFAHIAALPLHGITSQGSAKACYRVLLPSAVPFASSLQVRWEHGSGNDDRGRYSGAAIYYQD